MENNFIYLDNASTTPLSENVLNIINSTYKNYWHNPSSTYELGIKCSTYLEKIRSKIAYIFQAEDGIRDASWSRGLGDVYKRQSLAHM